MAQSEILKSSYTGTLSVSLTPTGEAKVDCTPTTETIAIAVQDKDLVTFTLDNFSLDQGEGEVINAGKIVVDLEVANIAGGVSLSFDGAVTLENGSDNSKEWAGSLLGEVPVKVAGKADAAGNIDLSITITGFSGFDAIDVTFKKSVATAIAAVAAEGAYEVYSITGALVAKGEGVVNMNALDKGIYLVKQNGKTQKIVK